ncbi:MAG: GNAT family N-acetyltransferase [Cellulosilyticaceae bacterium]
MKLTKVAYSDAIGELLKSDEITNLNILGALNYEENVPFYVDDCEQPSGVYMEIDGVSYMYAKDAAFVHHVFETFEQKTQYIFSGIKRELAEKVKEMYIPVWENPCDIYYYPLPTVDLSEVKSEVVTIPVEEVERINHYYTFKDDWSIEAITKDLTLRPSAGIYEEGELVCWVLVHEDDSMGIMYTVEKSRRKGYAEEVSLVLMDTMLKAGKVPYIQILESNQMSPGLAKKCGFVPHGKCTWMEISRL